jgi:hypothetical protein
MKAPYCVCVCVFTPLSTLYTIVLQLLHSLYFGRKFLITRYFFLQHLYFW